MTFTVLGKAGSAKAANMRLVTPVDARDVGGVKSALAIGADPDAIMFRFQSPPGPHRGHLLAQALPRDKSEVDDSLELMRLLIEAGADVNPPTCYGWSPLSETIRSGYIELVRYLLENGANLDRYDPDLPDHALEIDFHREAYPGSEILPVAPLVAAAYGQPADMMRLLVAEAARRAWSER